MSRRERRIWIAVAVVGLLVTLEIGLDLWRGPEATVLIENDGSEPIENLVLTWRGRRQEAGRVMPGGSVRVRVAGRGSGTLALRYGQKGNAMGAYELPSFSPGELSGEGFKQVLRVRANEVERFQDDADLSLARRFFRNLYRGLGGEPDESDNPQ